MADVFLENSESSSVESISALDRSEQGPLSSPVNLSDQNTGGAGVGQVDLSFKDDVNEPLEYGSDVSSLDSADIAEISTKAEPFKTELMGAAERGDMQSAASVLNEIQDKTEKAIILTGSLVDAFKSKSFNIMKTFLSLGASPKVAGINNNNGDWNSLLELVESDGAESILTAYGASVKDKDRYGRTGLMRTMSEATAR